VLSHINFTNGDTRGNAGLLRDNGNLKWPSALQKEIFLEPRQKIDRLMRRAYHALRNDQKPDDATLNDLQAAYQQLQDAVAANAEQLTSDEYVQARRYLGLVRHAITALSDRNVTNFFNGNWTPRVKSVAELVQFMRDKGLEFAPATQNDEAAYVALYNALATFDAGMPRVVRNNSADRSEHK
jgi:hypothetical protein